MNLHPGSILISAPAIDDPYFEEVVIFITEYNKKGALGFIVNQPFPRKLNDLTEFIKCPPTQLYDGGPVDRESLFFIHQSPELIKQGSRITDSIHMGGDFRQVVENLKNGTLSDEDIKLFVGYSGWDENQLEEEMEEESWLIVQTSLQYVFSTETDSLWDELYKKTLK